LKNKPDPKLVFDKELNGLNNKLGLNLPKPKNSITDVKQMTVESANELLTLELI